jgi:hypothetical protein
MLKLIRKASVTAAIVVMTTILAPKAGAECGAVSTPHGTLHRQGWNSDNSAPASLLYVHDSVDPIVGMWKVTFMAEGNGPDGPPDDTPIDTAVVVWHSDGTEIMNSGRPPQDGDFCMGVWENRGRYGYKLNHFSWGGNDTTNAPEGIGNPIGPGQFRVNVFLSRDRNSYSGTFTLDGYDTSGNLTGHIVGVVKGTRITVNTPANIFF